MACAQAGCRWEASIPLHTAAAPMDQEIRGRQRDRQRDSQAEAIRSALGSELYNITCAAFRSLEESLIQTPLKGGGALDLEGRVSKDWG